MVQHFNIALGPTRPPAGLGDYQTQLWLGYFRLISHQFFKNLELCELALNIFVIVFQSRQVMAGDDNAGSRQR